MLSKGIAERRIDQNQDAEAVNLADIFFVTARETAYLGRQHLPSKQGKKKPFA
jgi:hypothetical protein